MNIIVSDIHNPYIKFIIKIIIRIIITIYDIFNSYRKQISKKNLFWPKFSLYFQLIKHKISLSSIYQMYMSIKQKNDKKIITLTNFWIYVNLTSKMPSFHNDKINHVIIIIIIIRINIWQEIVKTMPEILLFSCKLYCLWLRFVTMTIGKNSDFLNFSIIVD